ncbi:MAG: fatty acid desaturase, partial [Pirellulales bacterium]
MHSRVMFRIIAPMAAVSLLLLTVGATAAWYVHRQNKQATLVLSRNLDAGLNSERLVSAIQDVRQELDRCINQGEPEYLENALEIREETTLYLEGVARFDPDEELEDLIARTRRGHERIFDSIAELAEEPPGDDLAQQVHELTQELKPELLVPARELLEYNRAETQRDSERNKAIADRVGLGLLLLGACGAAAGVLGGVGINTAHEMGHKKESLERWLSKIALAQSCYGHFYIEHNRGHHVRVATPEDPASAR